MEYNSPHGADEPDYAENLQEFYDAIREYYDELFPVDEGAVALITGLVEDFRKNSPIQPPPICRYLGIGCATGTLENRISSPALDVTGIDRNPGMVETSQRRMKRGYSSTRFFEMSAIDIRRFLKPGSFNIIGCVNNTLPYLADETLVRKFLFDAKALLAPGGKLVLQFINFDSFGPNEAVRLPDRSSVRVRLSRSLHPVEEGVYELDAILEKGSGTFLELDEGTDLLAITRPRLEAWGREGGFVNFEYGGDYLGRPWTPESHYTVAILS